MINGGIFGPKMSGKTTLAKALSLEYWRQRRMASYVLDPWKSDWGKHAWVVNNEDYFWKTIWTVTDGLVIVDDGSSTIARDESLLPVFTMLRHQRHKLLVIGHNGVNLLPGMREELDTLYLFRQTKGAAKIWYENFSDEEIFKATKLPQYRFLHCKSFGGCVEKGLTLASR